ncbi:TPA: helix-turn-helix domain-containing protein [Legionella feeleii]
MNKLSKNLKNLLCNAKISENELARRTGVSQQIINRILSGENKNPKIATLNPLASYFMVSISQLIGEEEFNQSMLSTAHHGWREIPVINYELLAKAPAYELMMLSGEKLLVDVKASNKVFAIKMYDESMEPKFSKGTLLIFDSSKKPANGDFALFMLPNDKIVFRQVFIKNNKFYQKSLNPNSENYKLTSLNDELKCCGLLIQSRTDYI